MSQFTVIDDFLPEAQFVALRDAVMGVCFPWYYSDTVSSYEDLGEDYYFTHMFFDTVVNSDHYNLVHPIVETLNASKLLRIKGNFYPNVNKFIQHEMHTDLDCANKGAVFYVNTNDGGTVLANGDKIKSVANRILFFDPTLPHASTNCTDTKRRITINFNYL